jgi:hypothetical protein
MGVHSDVGDQVPARELILQLDIAQEERGLRDEEARLRKRMKMRCLGLSSLEWTMARQCSTVRQLREGDAKTAYFHLIARGRKRCNYIASLTVDGSTMADHTAMEEALHHHFAGVFGAPAEAHTSLNFQALGIQAVDLSDLEAEFSEEEVWAAIKALPRDKALGPDGFIGAFYMSVWSVIKQEVMGAIHAFTQADTRSLPRLNNTLILLLPESDDTERLQAYNHDT